EVFLLLMRTYLLYFFACLRLSDINVKPIKKEERHHYSCAKVVFLFQKERPTKRKKTLITPNLAKIHSKKTSLAPSGSPKGNEGCA
ncbi:MAG: hypothetical protein PUC35_02335, partial [Prevotellaceae bacterium]|nr:hypothetical protein [Prevotellaceae bacterium]